MTVALELLNIINERAEFLVVNKPQDLVCHPTKGDVYSSLVSRARLHLGAPAFLVNRLDRETSGLVLVAKSPEAAGELGRLFELGAVHKEYTAIVHGHVIADEQVIEAPLGKDEQSPVAVRSCVRTDGAPASTRIQVQMRITREGMPFSILRVIPLQGRKHQIRIHLAHVGHPIVGDKLYGADPLIYLRLVTGEMTEADRFQLILPNQALHAGLLRFPWRGELLTFSTPPPAGFISFDPDPDSQPLR